MARRIGIGVIGMGWMGEVHSRSYRTVRDRYADADIDPRLVVCADEVASRAQAAKTRFGFERATGDWQDVLADPEVDVISVTTPNHLHVEILQAAASAKKHVWCEKPVGRSPEETRTIAQSAQEAGVLSFVGYCYRWAPLVQFARQMVRDGVIGDLTHYRGCFFCGYGTDPRSVLSWRFQREIAGTGTMGDLLSHVVDMAHNIAGPVRSVVGNVETFIRERPLNTPGEGTHFSTRDQGPKGEVTNEDYVGALVRFANGAHGTFEACRVISGPQSRMAFEVHGTRGAIAWNFEKMNELEVAVSQDGSPAREYRRVLSGPEHPDHVRFNPAPGMGLGYDDLKAIEAHRFLASVVQGEQGEPGLREAVAVADALDAISTSSTSGCWETVPVWPAQ